MPCKTEFSRPFSLWGEEIHTQPVAWPYLFHSFQKPVLLGKVTLFILPFSNSQLVTLPACSLSRGRLFATLWTVARQAPLSMRFFRQEYWSGLPFPPPGDLPNPGIKRTSLASPAYRWILYYWATGEAPQGTLNGYNVPVLETAYIIYFKGLRFRVFPSINATNVLSLSFPGAFLLSHFKSSEVKTIVFW